MDLITYKKKMIPLIAGCLLFNLFVIFSIDWVQTLPYRFVYILFLGLNFFVNFYFLLSISKVQAGRTSFISNLKEKKIKMFFLEASFVVIPIWGLWFLYESFQDKEENSVKLTYLFITRFLPSLVITVFLLIAIFFSNNFFLKRGLYLFVPPSAAYIVDVIIDSKSVFGFKDNIKEICPNEEDRHHCVFKKIKEKHDKEPFSSTSVILFVAVDMMEVFRFKERLEKEEKVEPALVVIDHTFAFLDMACNRKKVVTTYISLGDILWGNFQVVMLEMMDTFIIKKFIQIGYEKTLEIATTLSTKTDASDEIKKLGAFKESGCYKAFDFPLRD